MREIKRTTCNRDCPDACSILATVEDGRITRLQGDPSHPITQGFLCYRTSHFLATQYHPERLTKPLLRESLDQPFREVSFAEAMDYAAQKLQQIRAESGPASIFHYRSGGTLGLLGAVVDYFFERFGPVTVKRGDICSGAGDAAQMTDFGIEDSNDVFDLYNAKNIVIWGKNVWVSSPHLIPILREARQRGATLTLIDPVWHRTATLCDRHFAPRPGGDFALAMAVAQILARDGLVDPHAQSLCDNWNDFFALVNSRTVEGWCREAEIRIEDATLVAHRLGVEKPAAILVGWGMARRRNGASIVRALDALGVITGNLFAKGGGVSYYYKRRGAFDTSFGRQPDVDTAPRSVCEPLFGQDVLAMADPPIRAVWITAGNPVVMLPDSQRVAQALRSREFVVVVDSMLTDTAELAHLVLPCNTLLEADDVLGAYGHHYLGVARPVVPPPVGVKSDLEIIQELAARVGLGEALAGSARDWQQRIVAPKLAPHGVTLEQIEAGPVKNPLAKEIVFSDRKFATPSGRVNLIHQAPPGPPPDDAEYPLLLLAMSSEKSQCSQWPHPPEGPIALSVHPSVVPGIADGALVCIESRHGTLTARLHHDEKQRPDVALMPKGGHLRDGRCANVLIAGAVTDLGEGGALYDERVRVKPLPLEDQIRHQHGPA